MIDNVHETNIVKNKFARACGLLLLFVFSVWQSASAQTVDAVCPTGIVTPLAVNVSEFGVSLQSPLVYFGAFFILLVLLIGVVRLNRHTMLLMGVGLLGMVALTTLTSNVPLDAQSSQGVHCVCHAEDVVTPPPLIGMTGEMQGVTDHEMCRPEGLYDSGVTPPFCKIYDTDGREVMTSARRVIGYFATWRTGKNGLPAFLVTDIPWGKLTHINYAFGHVNVEDNYALSVNTDIAGNSGTDMTWPEYGITMDDSLPYTGHFNLFAQQKEIHPNVKLLLSVGGWAETGGYWTEKGSPADLMVDGKEDGFAPDGGFYAMTTNADGSVNTAGINAFADSSVDFLREYPFFDGIDIDYEYASSLMDTGNPTDFHISNNLRGDLNASYDVLMRVLREKLDQAGIEDDRYYQLTVAAPASSYMLRGLEGYGPAVYLDFLNMMSYDLHGSWNAYVGHQASLYDTGLDPELGDWGVYDMEDEDTAPYMQHGSLNTDWAAKYFAGIIPPGRINVGIPYYTRGWQGVEGGTNGLWGKAEYPVQNECPDGTRLTDDPRSACGFGAIGIDNIWHDLGELGGELGSGAGPMWMAKNLEYGNDSEFIMDIVQAYANPNSSPSAQEMIGTYERHYDEVAVAPWLWNAEKQVFLSTEDEQSFDVKVDYVIDNELGGIMFWEMSGDYSLPDDHGPESGYCDENYFMGSTLTSRGFNELQTTTPYGIVLNDRAISDQAVDVTVTLGDYPLGDDNYPYAPMLTVTAGDGTSLGGAVVAFDMPTSAPPDVRVHWSVQEWPNKWFVEVVDPGHTDIGNVGGLQGDFHRVQVTLPDDAGSEWSDMMAFFLPISGISAVEISMDGGSTWYAAGGNMAGDVDFADIPLGPQCTDAEIASAENWADVPNGVGGEFYLHDGQLWMPNWWTSSTPGTSADWPSTSHCYLNP